MSVKKSFYDLVPNVSRYELNDWFDLGIKLGISKETLILTLCKEYDLYFDYTLARNIGTLGSYIKDISIFPQYEGKKFKDSLFGNIDGVPVSCNLKAEKELDLLTALKNEQQLLLGKMKKVIEEDNIGTYKNLVLALKEITGLVQNEEYRMNYEKAYVEADRDSICIYYKGEKTLIKTINNSDTVLIKVKEVLSYNKQIPIYIDTMGSGVVIYDILKFEGYNVINNKQL